MCGISALIRKDGAPIDEAQLRYITNLVAHRGPDGLGIHIDGAVALGHRHLAIIDKSQGGRQPLSYGDRYWITYNGAIYNYVELRAELEKLGATFHTATDTEVVLAAYAQWGTDCLRRFNGMWAFVIYDSQARTVLAARDRFGVKPLYYLEKRESLAFGSEIKQLLALQDRARANDSVIAESLLTHFGGHTDETYFADIKAVPAAHYFLYSLATHTFTKHRYYDLVVNETFRALPFDEAVSSFKDLFDDAVRLRLRSDAPIGAALSGGLDSSTTCAVAAHQRGTGGRFLTFHAKSTEKHSDESDYAQACADRLGLDLVLVEPSVEDFKRTIDEVVYTQEEPFGGPSMFMGWHVFREAHARNVRVMLSGQGGDETLLGYDRYYAAMLHQTSGSAFWRELWLQSHHSSLSLLGVFRYYLYFTRPALRMRRLRSHSYLKSEFANRGRKSVERSAASFRDLDELQKVEIGSLQLPRLLRYDDRNSMRHSIETRMPFMDYRLVELATSLPAAHKIHDGWRKYILRKAFGDQLPDQITWQKTKIGFEAPDKTWLQAHDGEMKREIEGSRILDRLIDKKRLLRDFAQISAKARWAHFNIAVWERVYNVV
jgi:asparagine synthase (glutamine-hydrolysing)